MKYVLDANVFIEASKRYYSFDLAPAFWRCLLNHAGHGKIISIDRVFNELNRLNDKLAEWAQYDFRKYFISTDEDKIITKYSKIISWVQNNEQFTDTAKTLFANGADGWLVAYAAVHDVVIVTQETFKQEVKKQVPIPNVCKEFKVRYMDTFEMLRNLNVHFD